MLAAGPSFVEALTVVDIPAGPGAVVVDQLTTMAEEEALWHALVLGVRDYCNKTGFKSAVLGLSGGIDSAVVGVIASAALGAGNVLGVSLPSRYSSQGSKDDARELAGRLGVRFETIGIEEGFVAVLGMLAPAFAGRAADVTEETLQSRIRGTVLMGLSNKFGGLLLTTGNKSESGVGYCTLYGDMNGGLAVISDVSKMMVYRLARWCNENWQRLRIAGLSGPPIPQASISKPPSAELRPGQTDQDSLPAYEVLDEILRRRVELRQSAAGIVQAMRSGPVRADEETIRRVLRLVDISEFKRRQSAIGLKVTGVAFGSGRRMPIAQGYGQ
jgi:NAD+ synthase/NAD+ synthase (glutamine-hydrolysing)